jgi:DNA-binding PadR family transcriptional regulator
MALNSTAACVLGLLDIGPPPPDRDRWEADGTMSGSEIWTAVERSVGGFWSMTRSQVYQELRRVSAAKFTREATPARYAITAEGRDAVRQWFHEFALRGPRPDQVRSPVELAVFFGQYIPREVLQRVVAEHRLLYHRRLDVLRRIEAALDQDRSLPGSTLHRAILNLGVAIDWTNDVDDRLGSS